MLAELCRIGVIGVAHLQAEDTSADEVDPFDDLGVLLVVVKVSACRDLLEGSGVLAEAVGEYDTAEGISLFVSAMRIEFCLVS
jgi:hypothetical protein